MAHANRSICAGSFFSISRAKSNMETRKKNGFSRSKFTGKSKFLTVKGNNSRGWNLKYMKFVLKVIDFHTLVLTAKEHSTTFSAIFSFFFFIFLAIFALWKVWPVRINHLIQYSSCCFLVEITHTQISTIISLCNFVLTLLHRGLSCQLHP